MEKQKTNLVVWILENKTLWPLNVHGSISWLQETSQDLHTQKPKHLYFITQIACQNTKIIQKNIKPWAQKYMLIIWTKGSPTVIVMYYQTIIFARNYVFHCMYKYFNYYKWFSNYYLLIHVTMIDKLFLHKSNHHYF